MILKKRFHFLVFLCFLTGQAYAQRELFNDRQSLDLVMRGADHIYSLREDSSRYYIHLIHERLPNHPIVPMMEAMRLLWAHIPIIKDSVFIQFEQTLFETIVLARNMDRKHPESIFFEMTARGLLAEQYADKGNYLKAISEAGKAYELLKRSFELAETYPEFLFPVGIYNYFRVVYPEKYPIYKPLVWWFREGNKEKGLAQIREATQKSIVSRIEANIYLSYIYLRYEQQPAKAQRYMQELYEKYPTNLYITTKYLESVAIKGSYNRMPQKAIQKLIESEMPYYRFAGHVFQGIHLEKNKDDPAAAFEQYNRGIEISRVHTEKGGYYKSLAYLGGGRVLDKLGRSDIALKYYEQALVYAETDDVKKELNERLAK